MNNSANAVLTFEPGDMTEKGNPKIVDFRSGCVIKPRINLNSGVPYENKTLVTMPGGKPFTVREDWKSLATRAGYGEQVTEFKKLLKGLKGSNESKKESDAKPTAQTSSGGPPLPP